MEGLLAHCGSTKVDRDFLKALPTPEGTLTHQPIGHHSIVLSLIEALSFRHIEVVKDEYAVSPDGNRMFGVMELNHEFTEARFAVGLRNSHDKTMRFGLTVGYRVFVCDNLAFSGDFTPVLAKHSKNFNLIDAVDLGVAKIQRNFEPIKRTVQDWKQCAIPPQYAKAIFYDAFVEKKLKCTNIIREVHEAYFRPKHEEFKAENLWSVSNAFTEAFKTLKPVKQYETTARLSPFLNKYYQPF